MTYLQNINNHFPNSVRTCSEAVKSRNISLDQELKTIVLSNKNRIFVIHMLANTYLSRKKLNTIVKKTKFVDEEYLKKYDLEKGIINPISVTSMCENIEANIICKKVFSKEHVYTNNGTLTGTYVFETMYLKEIVNKLIIMDISDY